jgi:hypothetical protein
MPDTSSDRGARRRPRFLLPLLSVLIGFGAPLLVAEVVLRFLPRNELPPLLAVNAANPLLRFTPRQTFTYTRGWDFSLVTRGRTNNLGFVNDQDYDSTAATPLLAIVGDSFIEALMVPYAQTLQGRLAALAGSRARVYSFGVSGAPLSHYLVEADYARATFHPSAYVVLVVGNDFDESLLQPGLRPGLWRTASRCTEPTIGPRRRGRS